VITNLVLHIFFLLKTTTVAKTRSCIGWNISVVWDVTPLGRKSTSLLRSRTDGRIKFQEAGYPEMLVRVYSMPHTSLWRNVQLNRGANLTVLQPLVLRNWTPIIIQSCQRERERERETFHLLLIHLSVSIVSFLKWPNKWQHISN